MRTHFLHAPHRGVVSPAAAGGGGGGGTLTDDDFYIRTYEPVDSNTLLAEDFSAGDWYSYDADHSNSGLLTHGWFGNIYAPINPAGAVVGGGVGLHGRTYAATSGYHSGGEGGVHMAQHSLLDETAVTEAYFRIYFKPLTDYVGGHEKMFDFLYGGGGSAQMIALGYNYFGSNTFRFIPYLHQDGGLGSIGPSDPSWMQANLTSNLTWTLNHWYYLEMRVVLNTPGSFDGIFEFWMDDCGVDGTSGPGTPTKRGSYTDVLYRDSGGESSYQIRGIWIENWANPGTTGTMYYANVYVSRSFIGFADPNDQP